VAWVRGQEVVAVGATPPLAWLRALPARHAAQHRKGQLESIRLGQEEPAEAVAPATGFLATSLPDGSVLALFRREYVHEVHWGGEPMKAVSRSSTGRLMPRESFALWHETVRGTCLPWTDEERGILALAARHLATLAIPPEVATLFSALGTAESLAVRCLPELLLPHLAAAVTQGAAANAPTVLVSDALLRLMGADGPDLVGRPWHQVASRLHLGGAFPRPGVLDQVIDAWSPRGGLLHLRVRREPLLQLAGRHADLLGHWLVHVLDETHAHRVTAALQAASRRAEQANQARIAIMRNLNHEMRTPLNAILGFSELIARVGPGADEVETVQGFATEIQRAGQHLLQVVDGMLDLARIEAGGLHPDRVSFDLAACLRDCCAMCAPEFDRKAILLRCAQPGRPVMVQGDVRMIRQVLINLLANAAKFTPANGAVACGLELRHGQVEIRVTDNGPGIPVDQQRRIFAPMVQGDAAVTRQQGGLGLGLFIGRAFMEVHGGRLDVQSRPGKGATFLATLPLSGTAPP
jgi:signal transduction histidine kinase